MTFGEVLLEYARGAILAHAIALPDGRLAKGSVLDTQDIARLRCAGLTKVMAAVLEPGDLHEDAAASAVGQSAVCDPATQNLRLSKATTGRVNLYATCAGITEIDAAAVNRMNAIDPMITLATVRRFQRVQVGQMIGTVKIISYGVPQVAVNAAVTAIRCALRVRPAKYHSAVLIETMFEDDIPSDKGRRAVIERLNRLNVSLAPRIVTAHDTDRLADTLQNVQGGVILILTASATSDAQDIAPLAVRRAGGRIARFGMPTDPGNLLFTGQLGDTPVIGMPGCARSVALNGFDPVLERVLCGISVDDLDIAGMGVGGLFKEIPTRPRPRDL